MSRQRKHRANGEGTVYKRGDRDTYVAELTWVDRDTNAVVRRCTERKRKEDARAALDAFRLERAGVLDPKPRRFHPFRDFAEGWLTRRRPALAPNTYAGYESHLRLHLLPFFGDKQLAQIREEHVSAFLSSFSTRRKRARKSETGETTRQQCLMLLKMILADAVETGEIAKIPFRTSGRAAIRMRVEREEMRFLDEAQQAAFVAAASGDRLEALFVLAIATGMREGELLGLRWRNVRGRSVVVQRRLDQRSRQRQKLKTSASSRVVEIDDETARALERHRARMLTERAAFEASAMEDAWIRSDERSPRRASTSGSDCGPDDLVFVTTAGTALSVSNMTKRHFAPLLRKAGLPRMRVHDLRHSHASLLLHRGISPIVVQKRLGHANVATTLSLYGHLMPTSQREAADAVGAILWRTATPRTNSVPGVVPGEDRATRAGADPEAA